MEDDDSIDDDKIEELYADPAALARGRVRDVERVEVVIDLTPPSTAQVQDNRCTAATDNLCGMKTASLTIGGHVYLTCHKKVCG